MKHIIVCDNCKSENPFYRLICHNCRAYLREKIYNINLWETFNNLVHSPSKAFRNIIFAEHKNFIVFIIFIVSVKFFIDSMFLSLAAGSSDIISFNLFFSFLIIAAIAIIYTLLFSLFLKFVNQMFGLKTRFKDNLSILIFSFIPHLFALVIIFPIEVIVFGNYLFTSNPSPFMLKETIAYLLLSVEILIILWSIFLTVMGIYSSTKNVLYSIITGLFFNSIIFYLLYEASKYLYR